MRRETQSKTFELAISEGGIHDEAMAFEVEATAEITPYTPEQPPSYASGGEPAEGGYAEVTLLQYIESIGTIARKDGGAIRVHDVSWLIDILPTHLIEAWGQKIYEQSQEGF